MQHGAEVVRRLNGRTAYLGLDFNDSETVYVFRVTPERPAMKRKAVIDRPNRETY